MANPTPAEVERKHITYVSLEELQTPSNGFVEHMHNRWWIVDPDKGALIYRKTSPQCNGNRTISERLRDEVYPGCEVVLVEHAYRPHNCGDYL